MAEDSIGKLLKEANAYYRKNGRAHLPWRKTKDPYKIMVSEVMLQQTQVDRVIPFYKTFIKEFPTVQLLAQADLPEVLKLWQGLGYNRRGKMLRDAAKIINNKYNKQFPKKIEEIESLPGIGPYTARAISAFAYNTREVFVETNIRTVFFHHFFDVGSPTSHISDPEILPMVESALRRSRMEPREFYAMLMDYGSFLKKSGVKLNSRSKHYTKQSRFEGSRRQLRGQILRLLLHKSRSKVSIIKESGREVTEVDEELARLQKENLIAFKHKKYFISQ